jgi:hypothetical protein
MIKLFFAKIIMISLFVFLSYGCATDSEEVVKRPSGPSPRFIYLEQESIVSYFEVTNINEYRKLIPSIFRMPERPLCRVAFVDFYKMESPAPYQESQIHIFVKYKKSEREKEILTWYCLEMPVTTEDALWGRFIYGYPKVLRKVTLENQSPKYIGTSYSRDGKTPALKLILEIKPRELTSNERSFLDFISPERFVTIKEGKVFNWGAIKNRTYELEKVAPHIWSIQFGDCTIEYPNDPKNYLNRLGLGKSITGYWLKQKYRYSLKPQD